MVCTYVFADESGDFADPSIHTGATPFLALGTATVVGDKAMRSLDADLLALGRSVMWRGLDCGDYFHASNDRQHVRNAVFEVIAGHPVTFDVTLIAKDKVAPEFRTTDLALYEYMWWCHFGILAPEYLSSANQVLVVAASVRKEKQKRRAYQSTVEQIVDRCISGRIPHRITVRDAAASPGVQVADYGTWAVTRAWANGDYRALSQVRGKVRLIYDHTASGTTYYRRGIPFKSLAGSRALDEPLRRQAPEL